MKISGVEFTIFDVETTGLFPNRGDRICEIAAVRVDSSCKKAKKFSHLVDPERPISYGAFKVNGITAEMLAGQPTIDKILPRFMKFAEDSVLVAYNAPFDLGFLETALDKDRYMLDEYIVIDALALARRLFPDAGRYNLGSVSKHLNIDQTGEHRALADACTTWKVFAKELEALSSEGVEDIESIAYRRRGVMATHNDNNRIELINSAIRDGNDINITYRSSWNNEISKRTITPIQIQNSYDRSYVIAFCHLRKTERNFRLDCIVDAEIAEKSSLIKVVGETAA